MKFMDHIFKFLGFEAQDVSVVKKTKKTSIKSANYNLKKDKNLEDNINGVKVFYPENLAEVKQYVALTKKSVPYFVSFKFATSAEREKILDYLDGAVSVLEAEIKEVKKDKLYIILPKGVVLEDREEECQD